LFDARPDRTALAVLPVVAVALSLWATGCAGPAHNTGAPTYSEVLQTVPEGTYRCNTVAEVTGTDEDGEWSLRGTVDMMLAAEGLEPMIRCYGTQITLGVDLVIEGTAFPAGTLLTVDGDLHWVEVASWD
jgi:hypothetical protein